MNEKYENNMSIINNLNKVEGFDPSIFLRKLSSDTGEEQLYLDVKYRKLWFRLKYPNGKITKNVVKLEPEYAVIECKVYLDRNDPEDAYVSCAMAQRWKKDDDIYGLRYVETAETAAAGRALADAGFGIQFAEPGEEHDANPVDSPVTISVIDSWEIPDEETALEEKSKTMSKKTTSIHPKTERKESIELKESMAVDDLMQIMSLEEAKKYIIPFGEFKGQSMGDVCLKNPKSLNWFVEGYSGNRNILRASAKLLLEAAG